MKLATPILLGIWLMGWPCWGSDEPLSARRATDEIKIDGVLDDAGWLTATRIGIGFEWSPGDNVPAPVETETSGLGL